MCTVAHGTLWFPGSSLAFQKYPVDHVCKNPVCSKLEMKQNPQSVAKGLSGRPGSSRCRTEKKQDPTTSNAQKEKNRGA
jgi:hypothetical protein